MPPAYVKPYVKRGKNDANDAEAICEAVTRPNMRFVAIKSPEQQAALAIHRTRDLLVKQRTQLVNMIRGLLAEFGIDIPRGLERALLLARRVSEGELLAVPQEAAQVLLTLSRHALETHLKIRDMERDLLRWHRDNDLSRRLASIPGIGPIGASALTASVTDPHQFRSGRQFAAWLGLTPQQNSSGGKERLGRITKMGDRYLRKLLFVGAMSMVRRAKHKPEIVDPRLADLLARKGAPLGLLAGVASEFIAQPDRRRVRKRRLPARERRGDGAGKHGAVKGESLGDHPEIEEILHAAVAHFKAPRALPAFRRPRSRADRRAGSPSGNRAAPDR